MASHRSSSQSRKPVGPAAPVTGAERHAGFHHSVPDEREQS